MFWDVVYYHCSEFHIFQPLNSLHFSVLSLYSNSVQNQAWCCLHFSDHSRPKQTDVIFSRFVSCHWLLIMGDFPAKIDQSLVFPSVVSKYTNTCLLISCLNTGFRIADKECHRNYVLISKEQHRKFPAKKLERGAGQQDYRTTRKKQGKEKGELIWINQFYGWKEWYLGSKKMFFFLNLDLSCIMFILT